MAEKLRALLRIRRNAPIKSLARLVESQFLLPICQGDVKSPLLGFTVRFKGQRAIFINTSGSSGYYLTLRSSLAHELCHALFDRDEDFDLVDNGSDFASSMRHDVIEARANAFGAEFLLPRQAAERFIAKHGYNQESVSRLAAGYGVTPELAENQIKNSELNVDRESSGPSDRSKALGIMQSETRFSNPLTRASHSHLRDAKIPELNKNIVTILAACAYNRSDITLSRLNSVSGIQHGEIGFTKSLVDKISKSFDGERAWFPFKDEYQ